MRIAQNGPKIGSTAYMDPLGGVEPHAHWRITPSDVFTDEVLSIEMFGLITISSHCEMSPESTQKVALLIYILALENQKCDIRS